jgi:hypothetical protein
MVTVSMIQHTYIKHTVMTITLMLIEVSIVKIVCNMFVIVRMTFVIVRTCQSAIMITDSMNDMLLLGVVDI